MNPWDELRDIASRDAEYARHDAMLDRLEKGRPERDERAARDALYGARSGMVEVAPVEPPEDICA